MGFSTHQVAVYPFKNVVRTGAVYVRLPGERVQVEVALGAETGLDSAPSRYGTRQIVTSSFPVGATPGLRVYRLIVVPANIESGSGYWKITPGISPKCVIRTNRHIPETSIR